jgi:hypothetical protein
MVPPINQTGIIIVPKFKPVDECPAVEMSDARHRLADLQKQDAAIRASVQAETDNHNRLDTIHAAVAPARAELAAHDAQDAVGMTNWAKGLANGKPTSDAKRRAELVAELADAEQSSAAAKVAQAEFLAAVERLSQPLPRLGIAIREAAKVVACEEATKLLPEITAAIAKADSLRLQLDAAREAVLSGFEFGSSDYSKAGAALHDFDNARGIAEGRPMSDASTCGADWRRFAAALERDASISFEDAGTVELPYPTFNPTALDPVMAAAAAAASFESQSIIR